MAVLALDLGGTKLSAAIVESTGEVLERDVFLLEGRGGKEVGALIRSAAERTRERAIRRGLPLEAVGMCVPGISHPETVWAPNIPGWDEYPLLGEMRSVFPAGTIPVRIDSDRACAILGEVWQGAARGCRDAIFLVVGTGIGAGILAGGTVLRGAHDIAGAIGWLALDRPFEENYVRCGCFEYHASGEGLAKSAREYAGHREGYRGPLAEIPGRKVTTRDVFEAYDAGDPVARRVVSEAIEFWGMATANLVSLFNPEKIIFGGGVFGPGLRFLDAIRAEAGKWAQPISIGKVSIEGSKLGTDAVLYGAAYLALQGPAHLS